MKKLVWMFLLIGGFLFSQSVQAQKTRYYYYPDRDVYYNPGAHTYSWNNNGNWTSGRQLPEDMRVDRHAKHVTIYHNNERVWEDNDMHRRKYGRHHDEEGDRNRHEEHEGHDRHDRH